MNRSSDGIFLHYRNLLVNLSLFFLLACTARASQEKRILCVVNTKPPSVAVIDSETWQLIATIPIDEKAARAVLGPDGRFLFVTHQEAYTLRGKPKSPSQLSVVDLQTRQVVKKLPVDYSVTKLALANNGSHLIYLAIGARYAGMAKGKEGLSSLTVIDARDQEVVFRASGWQVVRDAAWTSDVARIFVLGARKPTKYRPRISHAESRFEARHPENYSALRYKGELTLSVFKDLGKSPITEFRVGERPAGLARSRDEKWLYVLDLGTPSQDPKKNHNGAVHVVEVETGKLAASFDVGVLPVALAARSGSDDLTVFGEDSVDGETGKLYRFRGNQMLPGLELGNELGRDPDKALYLSRENKLAILTMSSQVGIVDLQQNRVEHLLKAGRGGTTSLASVAAGALLMGAVAAGATAAAGAPVFIFPGMGLSHPYHLGLISRPDERVLYALDTSSGDVTAIDSREGTVISHIKVGADCGGLFLSARGKFLWALSPDDFILIDTDSNQNGVKQNYGPDVGKMKMWAPLDENRKLVFLFNKALQVWDADEGKLLTTVEGLSEPKLIALPYDELHKAAGSTPTETILKGQRK